MKTRMLVLAALIAAILVGGFSHDAFAKGGGGGSKTRITLAASSGFAKAKGKADYKAKSGEREFQVEVENIKSLKGQTVNVLVNGSKVGSAKVNALGEARLNLNSDAGQTVPNIKAGDSVTVTTAAGVLIVSGKF